VIEAARALKATDCCRGGRFASCSSVAKSKHVRLVAIRLGAPRRAGQNSRRGGLRFWRGAYDRLLADGRGDVDVEEGLREILKPLASWDINHHTLEGDIGTDNWISSRRIPTLVAEQDEANYLPNYHAASDTFDKVDIRELKINTALAAVTAWGIADRPEPLGKRLSRIETSGC